MKITTGLYGLSLIVTLIIMGGCASSQPKLTQAEVLSQYPQVASLNAEVKDAQAKGSKYLAPKSYETARKNLDSAMSAAHNNEKEDASEAAAKGLKVIDKMKKDTASSKRLLNDVLQARKRAMAAGVATLQSEKLAELDKSLRKTSELIEDGSIEKAKRRRPELLQGYSQLELMALKKGTVELARTAIANAKKQGAESYAPKTLAQSEEKMALAVSILDADRTQTSKAEAQAKNARWLAEKSAVITETVKDFDRRDYTKEDIILWHQAQMNIVNEPIGGKLPFNESSDAVALSLKASIEKLKSAEGNYSQQLAATKKEREAMLARDRAVKKQFETVQAMFSKQEANVYLQRQNVLISAHGFQFPSGVSEIQTANFPLMSKIVRAIKLFPNSRIDVSGHTDSTGAGHINKALSQARAEKVSKFLSEVGDISSKRIKAVGYGESRPVASNMNAKGRAENRRVEITIINE
ncbi:MAG: OmpA family protein [Gammaproteobacteria bacterium]|nr:OmpA family protein [Gammaproteobacteria bacterium]